MGAARRAATRRVAGVVLTVGAASALAVGTGPAAVALTVTPTGSFVVVMRGLGHGHGMSQWGARGAAIAGLSAARIVHFYYPNTRLARLSSATRIRVGISDVGGRLTVAPATDLIVTGVTGTLPTTGVARLRLIADTGRGLALQKRDSRAGAPWVTLQHGLPNRAEFHRTGWGPVRLFRPDGSSTAYDGFLRAVRNTASGTRGGVTTVNRVALDNYTAGVVPREMPTSWAAAAVNAQAIAARTYGAYHLAHPLSARYDICDTPMCQVYGGQAQFNSAGQLMWRDYPRAARATANEVLLYGGAPILAQFSASNGGWTVSGGMPYLVAKQDPYDTAASGDPWLNYRKTLSAPSIANYFGLRKVTSLVVLDRDGNGSWNGRVLGGYIAGTDSAGDATRVRLTGAGFAAAFGIGTTWFALRSAT
jgi:peptidoglycan hydrolase-like amidase